MEGLGIKGPHSVSFKQNHCLQRWHKVVAMKGGCDVNCDSIIMYMGRCISGHTQLADILSTSSTWISC